MTLFNRTRSIAVGLVAATAIAAATPALAQSWKRPAVAAGLGFAAGTMYGAAIAHPYAYGSAYAYAPLYGNVPGQPYVGGDFIVGDSLDGAPIYASELGPNCTFGQKQFELC